MLLGMEAIGRNLALITYQSASIRIPEETNLRKRENNDFKIDHAFYQNNPESTVVLVLNKFDTGSDHRIVRAVFHIYLKIGRQYIIDNSKKKFPIINVLEEKLSTFSDITHEINTNKCIKQN